MLGFLMSLPLALGDKNTFSRTVTTATRCVIGAIRTVPSILFGVIFVVAFGLGPAAGTLGRRLLYGWIFRKIYYEAFEAVDREVIEAVRSTGCNRVQLLRLPSRKPPIRLSVKCFMFEYNIRSSTIMGFVGAGGLVIICWGICRCCNIKIF